MTLFFQPTGNCQRFDNMTEDPLTMAIFWILIGKPLISEHSLSSGSFRPPLNQLVAVRSPHPQLEGTYWKDSEGGATNQHFTQSLCVAYRPWRA